jgi:hypothetical protein
MSYTTSVFVYTQRQIVVLLSGFSPRKYMPQYAKTLTLHKGVDNQIQFQFLNQEQKPVDITGKEITCRIISYDGSEILLQKALTIQLGATGIAALILNAADIEDIPAQKAHYSLEIPVGVFDYPVFVDQNGAARGDMNIVNSVLPAFIPSQPVSIPTGQPFPNLNPNANVMSNANTYYSSVINTNDNPILTLQVRLEDYFGEVGIEGSSIGTTDWYPIESHEYTEEQTTGTYGYTVKGYHPYIRMQFVANVGVATNILSR